MTQYNLKFVKIENRIENKNSEANKINDLFIDVCYNNIVNESVLITFLLSCVYIGEGYAKTLATVTVTIYLHWPPWAMQRR
jgi:hypothetical protein